MSYNNCNGPCDPCVECQADYDNTGCLSTILFECIYKPGNHLNLGITDDMNAAQVLAVLNTKAANPYIKVTQTQRIDMTGMTVGTHVYQTDGGSAEGVYVFKSSGWIKAY